MSSTFVDAHWLRRFHLGERETIATLYRDHVSAVLQQVHRRLGSADAETVTHEVFLRLLTNADMRANFVGGNFRAWLLQVSNNAAIDYLRRHGREDRLRAADDGLAPATTLDASHPGLAEEVEAKILVDRFRRERLPAEWAGVFDARFLRALSQREAADELGMRRSTLVYREQRVRLLLREFLLGEEAT